ncbi:MAG: hypothetical protein H0W12_06030 [Chitinophagaceae bacterium]|nr:hypothetical protein [Chitinophagaceae bacterium]
MRKILLLAVTFISTFSAISQKTKKERQEENRNKVNAMVKQEEEGVISYRKSFSVGGKLINDGYGIFLEMGRAKSVSKGLLFQLEISERKSSKEEKQSNLYNLSTPFVFGKQNFFYPIKLGVQQETLIGNKSNKNGVSITANYGGGVTVGLLRPYYVQLESNSQYIKYESSDSSVFLDPSAISGGPGFSKGWSDVTIKPGLYAKTALRFDYGAYNEMVSAIEVGLSGEFYGSKIPIMVHEPQKQFFFSGYVAIIFGKRK